jgi:hypothetical protein
LITKQKQLERAAFQARVRHAALDCTVPPECLTIVRHRHGTSPKSEFHYNPVRVTVWLPEGLDLSEIDWVRPI